MDDNAAFRAFREFILEQIDALARLLGQEARSEAQRQRREKLRKILDTCARCLNREESEAYRRHVEEIDRSRRGAHGQGSERREAVIHDRKSPTKIEWECLDCGERWRTLAEAVPQRCMELAVDRHGNPRDVTGCGSTNIDRAKHAPRRGETPLASIVSGEYALVGGRQLRIRIDDEMGENEEEFLVDEREIVINGNHRAFRTASHLDGVGSRSASRDGEALWPAQTVHVVKCACLAWAEFHYRQRARSEEYKERYDELQASICESVLEELGGS